MRNWCALRILRGRLFSLDAVLVFRETLWPWGFAFRRGNFVRGAALGAGAVPTVKERCLRMLLPAHTNPHAGDPVGGGQK
jgi:hypothetical protein